MSLFKSTLIVSAFTLLSRISGLARDIVMAHYFGAGKATDAFFIAFKLPNFLRRLFGEGAFSQAFVPVLTEYRIQRDKSAVADLVQHTMGTLGGILILLSLVCVIAAPVVVMGIAWGYIDQPDKIALTTDMFRVTFPYILFISLTALSAGVLNSYSKFAVPAFTPILLNLSLIGCAIWLAPHLDVPVKALAWGVFIAGILQLGFQLPFLYKLGFLHWPRWGWKHTGVRRIMKLMLPGIVGSSVMQINLLFDIFIASFLVTGSITWLYYADRMLEFPLGVFGIALATVILPSLSEKHAADDTDGFSHMLDFALRWVIIIGLPAAVALFILAKPLLATFLQHGAYSIHAIDMSTFALQAYSFGLLAHMMVKVLAPGYYARQDTKTPMKIGLIAMASNMILNIVFVVALYQLSVEGLHAGLALATAASGGINAYLLWHGLIKKKVHQPNKGWLRFGAQVSMACVVMVGVLIGILGAIPEWYELSLVSQILNLLILVSAGGASYFVVLFIVGIRPKDLTRPNKSVNKNTTEAKNIPESKV